MSAKAEINTDWVGTGTTADPYRPALADDHKVDKWSDISGKDPTKGGVFSIDVECSALVLTAIKANNKYKNKVTDK